MDAVVTIASVVLARDFRAEGGEDARPRSASTGSPPKSWPRYLEADLRGGVEHALDLRLDGVRAGRRHVEHAALHARLRVALQPLRARRGGVDGDADRAIGAAAQLLDAREQHVVAADHVGHPVVAVGQHAVEHALAVAADEDRRAGALDGLGPRPDALELHVAPRVARLVVAPDRLHRLDVLAHLPEAAARVDAVVAHLLHVPAGAHAEQQAPARQVIDARGRLRAGDRLALGHEDDPEADPDRLGGRRGVGRGHERVEQAAVLARQLAAGGVRRRAARGDVGVLGEEHGLEPERLGAGREPRRGDRLVRGEDREPEVHAQSWVASVGIPSSTRPVSSQVAGATSMCCVAAWASRTRRCSGLDSYSALPPASV